ncbi:uncharacterized protein STEHIDRAFT_117659 [Stereum hirsutum FP-91666 SS1]|uniref:uncharacterized protein n=1 Tax=Stereum hirsutum (strain FP-91666) TaxID=721885 RepID=UPI000440C233|nr:uncharacterized protein STEHIDRAFT_117659 [Stereum hirsutum FP-91666 SS1]EIM92682.1 hypothetical protein STEHIDRAFT_117659 [Stereum hirsutum FP-91666 SS1]
MLKRLTVLESEEDGQAVGHRRQQPRAPMLSAEGSLGESFQNGSNGYTALFGRLPSQGSFSGDGARGIEQHSRYS